DVVPDLPADAAARPEDANALRDHARLARDVAVTREWRAALVLLRDVVGRRGDDELRRLVRHRGEEGDRIAHEQRHARLGSPAVGNRRRHPPHPLDPRARAAVEEPPTLTNQEESTWQSRPATACPRI